MKKIIILAGFVTFVMVFSQCNPAKKAMANAPKTTYEGHLSGLIMTHCSPCHIPAKGGNKKPYDNYANVKTDIDEIVRRIELNPTDKGFMPFKRAKLNDSTIAVFRQWRADGALEK